MVTEAKRNRRGRAGNGEGSVRLRADGRYEARITMPDGSRRSIFGKTHKEVVSKKVAALNDVRVGLPLPDKRQTLGAFLERWLEDSVKPKVAPSTLTSYSYLVRVHIAPALGRVTLEKLTPQRIQSFLNDKVASGLSPRTVGYAHGVLRAALNRAVKWGLLVRNPATLVDPPRRQRHEMLSVSAEDAHRILDAVTGHRLEAPVTLALLMGLRQGEVLGLRWSDVDFTAAALTVHHQVQPTANGWTFTDLKTPKARRTLTIPNFVISTMRAHRTRQLEERLTASAGWVDLDLVFPSSTGIPWERTGMTHEFQRRLAAAKLPRMRFHDLRHGAATLLLAKGLTLGEIQKVLGHSQISLTSDLYAHASRELMGNAASTMDAIFAAR